MYAIVKTGGKQYRVEEGQFLLVERLPAEDGAKISLEPLLCVDGSDVLDGDALARVKVEATILAHERGPKLRIVKFKPKRGYKRRTGHRQELTRLEVTGIKVGSRRGKAATETGDAAPAPVPAESKPKAEAKPKPKPKPKAEARPKAKAARAPEPDQSTAAEAADNTTPEDSTDGA